MIFSLSFLSLILFFLRSFDEVPGSCATVIKDTGSLNFHNLKQDFISSKFEQREALIKELDPGVYPGNPDERNADGIKIYEPGRYIVPNRDTIQVRHIKRSPKFTPTFELSSDATKIGTDVGASSSADQLASMTKAGTEEIEPSELGGFQNIRDSDSRYPGGSASSPKEEFSRSKYLSLGTKDILIQGSKSSDSGKDVINFLKNPYSTKTPQEILEDIFSKNRKVKGGDKSVDPIYRAELTGLAVDVIRADTQLSEVLGSTLWDTQKIQEFISHSQQARSAFVSEVKKYVYRDADVKFLQRRAPYTKAINELNKAKAKAAKIEVVNGNTRSPLNDPLFQKSLEDIALEDFELLSRTRAPSRAQIGEVDHQGVERRIQEAGELQAVKREVVSHATEVLKREKNFFELFRQGQNIPGDVLQKSGQSAQEARENFRNALATYHRLLPTESNPAFFEDSIMYKAELNRLLNFKAGYPEDYQQVEPWFKHLPSGMSNLNAEDEKHLGNQINSVGPSQYLTDTGLNRKELQLIFRSNRITESLDKGLSEKDIEGIIRQSGRERIMNSGRPKYKNPDPLLSVKESIYQIAEELQKVDQLNKIQLKRVLYYESINYFRHGGSMEPLLKSLGLKTSQIDKLRGNIGRTSGWLSSVNHQISSLGSKFKSMWSNPRNP